MKTLVGSLCQYLHVQYIKDASSAGGFSPHPGHDVNLHPTLSAIQILATQQALDRVNTDKLVACKTLKSVCPSTKDLPSNIFSPDIKTLQDPTTGAFMGDEWGETGTRFSYCAVAALALLGRLDALDRDLTVSWIAKCKNFDGGFGMVEGAESHAAYGMYLHFSVLFRIQQAHLLPSLDLRRNSFHSGPARCRRPRIARLVAERETKTQRRPQWTTRKA